MTSAASVNFDMSAVQAAVDAVASPPPTATVTANGAPCFTASDLGEPLLELFLSAARNVSRSDLCRLIRNAFAANRLIALRILGYIRDIRRGGKGERKVFREGLAILASICPEAAIHNFGEFVKLGRSDDLQESCEILMRQMFDDDLTVGQIENAAKFFDGVVSFVATQLERDLLAMMSMPRGDVSLMAKWVNRERQSPLFLITIAWRMGYLKMSSANVQVILGEDHSGRFTSSWDFMIFLHRHLGVPMSNRPSVRKGSDKRRAYQKLQTRMDRDIDQPTQAHTSLIKGVNYSLQQMRSKVLSPLNAYLDTVERKLCKRTALTRTDIEKMPGGAMAKYKGKALPKQECWEEILQLLGNGSMKIKGISVDLVSIIKNYRRSSLDVVTESQLTAIFENLLRNIATRMDEDEMEFGQTCFVSDVSGSMESGRSVMPIDVCCGLTIMSSLANIMSLWPKLKDSYSIEQVAQIAMGKLPLPAGIEFPYYFGRCITFSERPSFFTLTGCDSWRMLIDKFNSQPCGYSTNFMSVFENLVHAEQSGLVRPEHLPQRVVAITDSQFNSHFCGDTTSSTHRNITLMYQRELHHEAPQLIYWNVAENSAYRTVETDDPNEAGIAMMTGYNQNMVKHVLMDEKPEPVPEGGGSAERPKMTPTQLLLRVVNDPVYAGITLPPQ